MKDINQTANFALVEWPDNIEISATPPSEYIPILREKFTSEHWSHMHEFHGLPLDWENMDYRDFLEERRKLMAGIIRRGFESLK